MAKLNEQLLELRRRRGLTQSKVAQHLDISQISLSHWERGTREPSLDMLRKLAAYYNTSLDYLVGSQEPFISLECSEPNPQKEEASKRMAYYAYTFSNPSKATPYNFYHEKLFHLCEMLNEKALKELMDCAIHLLQNEENRSNSFKKSE